MLSKTLAEKEAWDYQASLPENERFELVTILPSLVVGEAFVGAGFQSGNWLTNMMTGKTTIERRHIGLVDVKSVA